MASTACAGRCWAAAGVAPGGIHWAQVPAILRVAGLTKAGVGPSGTVIMEGCASPVRRRHLWGTRGRTMLVVRPRLLCGPSGLLKRGIRRPLRGMRGGDRVEPGRGSRGRTRPPRPNCKHRSCSDRRWLAWSRGRCFSARGGRSANPPRLALVQRTRPAVYRGWRECLARRVPGLGHRRTRRLCTGGVPSKRR